jgi:hypothetical protein
MTGPDHPETRGPRGGFREITRVVHPAPMNLTEILTELDATVVPLSLDDLDLVVERRQGHPPNSDDVDDAVGWLLRYGLVEAHRLGPNDVPCFTIGLEP